MAQLHVMADLVQRHDHLGRRPGLQHARIATLHCLGQRRPLQRLKAAGRQRQCIVRPATCCPQPDCRRSHIQAVPGQPRRQFLFLGPRHGMRQAAAADGGQQLLHCFGGQHEAHVPAGSSSVLSKALAVIAFMRSAGNTSTTLPRPQALVRWENSIASRIASTRISRLGLRFLSSSSACAFSPSGQCRCCITVSGIRTHRSAWVRTSTAWQLSQRLQAPCAPGSAHNQARASSRASVVLAQTRGPCNRKA